MDSNMDTDIKSTKNVDLADVDRAGEDFIAHLAGAFLGLTVKEKMYGIQTQRVRKDQVWFQC